MTDYLLLALELQREVNNPRMLALTLVNCGTALVALDNEPDFAIELLENALGIAEDLDDVRTQLAARQKLAEALGQTGRLAEALAMANEQREESAKAGFHRLETEAMHTIGDLHLADSNVTLARASYEELLQVARDRSDQTTEHVAIGALAQLALHQGDKVGAVNLFEQQLILASSLRERAVTSGKLAKLALEQGDRPKAVTLLRDALEYYVSVNHEIVEDLKKQIRKIEDEATN